jgi:hypothetical protein
MLDLLKPLPNGNVLATDELAYRIQGSGRKMTPLRFGGKFISGEL